MKEFKNNVLSVSDRLRYGDFGSTAFGSLIEPMTAGDETKLAECMGAVQAVKSQAAATLELIASAVEAGEAGEKMRLAESLQLMAALVQFCVNATDVVLDANRRTNAGGGDMSLIKRILTLILGRGESREEEEKPALFVAVPTFWREAR